MGVWRNWQTRRIQNPVTSVVWVRFPLLLPRLIAMNFLRNIYDWTLKKAEHKNAKWYLSLISFAESSFFPIPPDILLIPMALASKARALFYAFICTIFSVLGGILGYAIGYFFIIRSVFTLLNFIIQKIPLVFLEIITKNLVF